MNLDIKSYNGVEIVHFDNVFSERELDEFWLLFEHARLFRMPDTKTAKENNILLRSGSGVFLHQLGVNGLKPYFTSIVDGKYREIAGKLSNMIGPLSPLQLIYTSHATYTDTLLQFYEDDNNAYREHNDTSSYSMCIFIHKEPKNFTGGQFYIKDLNLSVEKLNNTGILFPSYLLHGVQPVKIIDKNMKYGGRYSLSTFISEHEYWKNIYDKT